MQKIGERIAKAIARSGLCSRRDAEKLITEGKVKVDGKVITSPALNVSDDNIILVNNKPLALKEPARLWIYHKPPGLLTTQRDPEGRPTIFEALAAPYKQLKTVGRLDMNSEGVLLLTNDGGLARHLELPATGWARRYRVRLYGRPEPKTFAALKKGVTLDGVHYAGVDAEYEKEGTNSWLIVTLKEGKNREIRKLFEHFGHPVSRLIRMAYGPFQIGSLERGEVKEIPRKALIGAVGEKVISSL